MKNSKISVVIPVYNEGDNIDFIYKELNELTLKESAYDFEILFLDNHSCDSSFQKIVDIVKRDPRVRLVRLSRNFGYQANILAGYSSATGDAAIQLDADGEDDPQMISQFLRKWEEGYDVVYGVRLSREEGWLLQLQRKIFYRVMKLVSSVHMPVDSGDFRLIDRVVLKKLLEFSESSLYLRGLISFVGYNQIGIPYHRRARYRGESKFRWLDYFHLALDGVTSFSNRPLYLVIQLGFFLASVSFVGALGYLIAYFAGKIPVKGFTTLILVELLLAGIQLFCAGINGLYIGKIFEEVKHRPRSIVQLELNNNDFNSSRARGFANQSTKDGSVFMKRGPNASEVT